MVTDTAAFVKLPFMPPSVNNAYFTKGHMRVLSTEGKKFKNEVKNFLIKNHPEFLSFFNKDVGYEILFVVYTESLLNKSYMKEKGSTRYKRFDASNRLKLVEDAIVEAAGHDDSQHTIVSIVKMQGEPSVDVYVWREDGPIGRYVKFAEGAV